MEKKMDSIMHEVGYAVGRLDVVGGSEESLLELINEVHDKLAALVEGYWKDRETS